jgi:hypothetical protein
VDAQTTGHSGRPATAEVYRKVRGISPTIGTESVLPTALVDNEQGLEVAVVDIPGAFMQRDMDEEAFARINGKMAELLLEINEDMY